MEIIQTVEIYSGLCYRSDKTDGAGCRQWKGAVRTPTYGVSSTQLTTAVFNPPDHDPGPRTSHDTLACKLYSAQQGEIYDIKQSMPTINAANAFDSRVSQRSTRACLLSRQGLCASANVCSFNAAHSSAVLPSNTTLSVVESVFRFELYRTSSARR